MIPEIKALIFMKEHSERVPRKNIRDFCGRPLFHWILSALEASEYITSTIINTDSEYIAEEASKYFDVIIHKRPDYLLKITCNEANQIIEYDLSIDEGEFYLQTHSTNPFLKTDTINRAIEAFFEKDKHDGLMSVTPLQKRFYRKDGTPINHNPKELIKTQELPPIYEENSCIYIFSKEEFLNRKNRIGIKPLLFPIDPVEAIDIDEESDFLIAESIMDYLLKFQDK